MDVSLVMVKSDGSAREVKLDRDATIIGRDEAARLRIPLGSISRKHCEVRVDDGDGAVSVADLGSANGTYVNGKRVRQAELAPGDLLSVGPVVFVVRIDGHPKSIDARDSYAAGSVTDDIDDSGEFPAVSPTRQAPPPPRAGGGAGGAGGGVAGGAGGKAPTPAPAKKPADDDDDDDEDISDLLKDFDFGDDEDDEPPAPKKA